jgi:pimeloyl-ACP methyl ester carboxylesterase
VSLRIRLICSLAWALMLVCTATEAAPDEEGEGRSIARRRELLQETLRILPRSGAWEAWQQRTGELPPDFSRMSSVPYLPDPLRLSSDEQVTRSEDWPRRRAELLQLLQHHLLGKVPPPPVNLLVTPGRSREEPGAHVNEYVLEFGADHRARLEVELLLPKGPGPFPVFMTPASQRSWAVLAVSRGYIGCVFQADETRDNTDTFPAAFPGFDWGRMARRGWAAGRCVDLLYNFPAVDRSRIALAGHGGDDGSAALIGAALDARITAVVASSAGPGGAVSWRHFSEVQFGGGIEPMTRNHPDWFHPRLRFFVGRENKLPMDQHTLIAAIAPRPCLISTALNDPAESAWAIERTLYAVRPVYALHGAEGVLALRYRFGGPAAGAHDVESCLDWLDTVFGRKALASSDGPVLPSYQEWKSASQESLTPTNFLERPWNELLYTSGGQRIRTMDQWRAKREDIAQRVVWGLGQAPVHAKSQTPAQEISDAESTPLPDDPLPPGLERRSVRFGNHLAGHYYLPAGAGDSGQRLPVVIWVHPISCATGFVPVHTEGEPIHHAFARAGFAVFTFDQIGNGSRLTEASRFYRRHPRWSLLGKQVADILAAVETVTESRVADPDRVYVVGYSTGGMAALHAAALEERVTGVVTIAGFMPMRTDTREKGTGGLARWSYWLPLQPRLGAFVGHESRVPYDYHDLLGMIAPRPALVVAPRIDSHANLQDVRDCFQEGARVYELLQAPGNAHLMELDDYNHLSPNVVQRLIDRLKPVAGL